MRRTGRLPGRRARLGKRLLSGRRALQIPPVPIRDRFPTSRTHRWRLREVGQCARAVFADMKRGTRMPSESRGRLYSADTICSE